MRRRTPRRNPVLEAPRPTVTNLSDMAYDTSSRGLNFVTDLLADKMDVIKRKAEMYTTNGYSEAANEMMKAWSLLKSAYDKALTEIMVLTRNEKGDPVNWEGVRQTQFAMDYADGAMRRFGEAMLSDIQRERANADSQISTLTAQISACSQKIEALQADHRINMAEKLRQIATLQEKIDSLTAQAESLKNAKAACTSQITALQAETLAQQKSLESKIKDQAARIASLQSQIKAAQSAHELGQSAQKDMVARLNQKIAECEATISSLTKAKDACDAQIATLRNEHASQIAEIDAKLQSQRVTAQQLNTQISALQGSGSSDQATIASLQQSLSDAQSEIAELQIAKTECEGQIAQLQEPLTLQTSAFTKGSTPDILDLNLSDRERIIAEIAKRDDLITQLRKAKAADSTAQKDLEAARNDAKAAHDEAKTLRYTAYGLGLAAFVATAYAIYKSRTPK